MEESIVQKKILLVEDSPAHKELMARELTDAGFEIDQVESFNQCKNWIIDYGLPALIVADYLLPDGNALDILALVSQECPVVIMTSHGSEQSAVEAVKAGAQDYVVKSQEVFRGMGHIVRRALRDWQHIEEVREAEKELIKKDSILNGLAEILSILLGSPDPSSVMHEVLAILGKSSECDRVSVFQNSYNENNVRCMTLTHEWVRHHSFAQLTNAEMRDLPYASLSVENERDLESGKTIQSIFHQMSLAERELFGAPG
jgi:CheY-like chemotaxis protein